GSYPFSVTAASGPLIHTFSMTLNVTLSPHFNLSCNPTTVLAVPGSSGGSVCSVDSLAGFNNAVTLSCNNLTAGASCSYAPNPVTPLPNGTAMSNLTVDVGADVPATTT